MITIEAPNHVVINRKKYFLNLNNALNWNKFRYQQVKKKFKASVFLSIYEMKQINCPVKLEVIYCRKDNHKVDLDNICIMPKFMQDAIVEFGKMQDDNESIITEISIKKGSFHI